MSTTTPALCYLADGHGVGVRCIREAAQLLKAPNERGPVLANVGAHLQELNNDYEDAKDDDGGSHNDQQRAEPFARRALQVR